MADPPCVEFPIVDAEVEGAVLFCKNTTGDTHLVWEGLLTFVESV